MKILMVSFLDSGVSGVQTYLDQTGSKLTAKGEEISYFILTGSPAIGLKYAHQPQTWVYYLPTTKPWAWLWSENIFNLKLYQSLRNLILETKPDLIHFHDLKALRTLLLASRGFKKVWTAHYLAAIHPKYELIPEPTNLDGWWRQINSGQLRPARLFLDYWLWNDLWLKKFFTTVICPSQIILDKSLQHGLSRSLHLPLYSDLILPINKKSGNYFLYIGRLDKQKGLKSLLNGFQLAWRQNPNLRLIIVGTGPLETFVKQFIEQNQFQTIISLAGFQTGQALINYYHGAQAVIIPSLSAEAGPLVALEAMRAGKAIIASKVGGIVDLIIDRENGLLVPPDDERALAAAILKLDQDQDLRIRLGQTAQAIALTQYTSQSHLNRLIKIYYQACLPKI